MNLDFSCPLARPVQTWPPSGLRDSIVCAAESAFTLHVYDEVQLDQVADACGVATSTD